MKLKFISQKKTRIKHQFMGFTTFEDGWWFNEKSNVWEKNPKKFKSIYCSHQNCKSIKAFRRKLKKAPKGVNFILVNRWVGNDVQGIGSFNYDKT